MNIREEYLWAVQIRPCTDPSGRSDCVICTPKKSLSRDRVKEIGGIYDIVWQGWIKHGRTALKRVF